MDMCAIFKCGEPVHESMNMFHIPCWCGHDMEEGEMGRETVFIGLCVEHFTSITEIWKFKTDGPGGV